MNEPLPPRESPGLILWRVTLAWQRQVTAALRPLGLTHVQFVLLTSTWWLTTQGGEQPTQKRVANFAGTDVMMTSQVLRTLEAKGLITRHEAPGDARAKVIMPTAEGATLAESAVAAVAAVDHQFFNTADPEQTLQILRTLDQP